ncbi:hypothetical protein Tco_1491723 [Tanacetum coccineum]
MQRFLRLTGFLGQAAGTAEEQAKNYRWGLHKSILDHVMCLPFTDVAQELQCENDELKLSAEQLTKAASALQALRRLGSIFTSVYVADQKLKKAYKVYKAGKRLLYVKRNKAISLGKRARLHYMVSQPPIGCMTRVLAGPRKPEVQWTPDKRKAANLDQRLKSLIMSVLPDDQMNPVINCLTAKSTWDDLILYHEGPTDVKESRVMDLKLCYKTFKFKEGETLTQTFTRYKALINEIVNDGIKPSKLKINTGFIIRLPKKWLSFCQSLRNTNHVKDSELASLFGKLKYEENLIDNIYENKKEKTLVSATPLSTAFFSTSIVQDIQDSLDDEEDTRSNQEYLNDLEEEYQARALLAKSKRFFKKGTQRFSSAKATDQTECHKCGKRVILQETAGQKLQFLHISHPFNQNSSPFQKPQTITFSPSH